MPIIKHEKTNLRANAVGFPVKTDHLDYSEKDFLPLVKVDPVLLKTLFNGTNSSLGPNIVFHASNHFASGRSNKKITSYGICFTSTIMQTYARKKQSLVLLTNICDIYNRALFLYRLQPYLSK